MAQISIIVPVYNEAENILPFYYELLKHIPTDYELVLVDDGSTDSTLQEIEELTIKDSHIKCISLTRNFGQANAVSAGLDFAEGSTIIIMSGNLKNPSSVIPSMLSKINDGYEVVNTSIINVKPSSGFSLIFFKPLYRFLNWLGATRNENDITRFRAINNKVISGIHQVKENNLSLGDFFSWSGYKTTIIEYKCNKCSRKYQPYTMANLIYESKKTIKNLQPGFYKSLLYTGILILMVSLSLFVWQVTLISKGTPFNVFNLVIPTLLLVTGAFLMIQSKKPEKKQLSKKTRMPSYLIKDIIEQEKNSYRLSF